MFEPLSELCIDIERPWDFLIRLLLGERFCWSTEMHKGTIIIMILNFQRDFFFDEWKSTDFWLVFRGWSFFCVVKIHQKFPLVKNPLFWWWFKSTWGWVCLRKIQMKRKWGKIMRICEVIRTLFYEYTWYAKLSSHEEMRNILWEDAIKKICCNFFWYEEFMLPWKKMKNMINIICNKVFNKKFD